MVRFRKTQILSRANAAAGDKNLLAAWAKVKGPTGIHRYRSSDNARGTRIKPEGSGAVREATGRNLQARVTREAKARQSPSVHLASYWKYEVD